MRKFCLALVVFSFTAAAQPAFQFRVMNLHEFRQRELIRIYTVMPPELPRAEERWQFVGLLLDPPAGCGTVDKPCTGMPRFGVFSGPAPQQPQIISFNDYVPILPPGHYRVSGLMRKLVRTSRTPGVYSYGYADPPQHLMSNTVEIEIAPVDAEWSREQLEQSVAGVRAGRREAASQLSLLDEPASWRASLDLLPLEESPLLTGLSRTTEPAKVCQLMQERIAAPEQSVSMRYLQTVAQICLRANLPEPPLPDGIRPMITVRISERPLPAGPVSPVKVDPAIAEYAAKRQAYDAELMSKSTAALAGSVERKQTEPKLTAFATLLEYLRQQKSPPAWAPAFNTQFASAYPTMEVSRRQYLLGMFASNAPADVVKPLLESTLDAWKPGDYYEAAQTAIRALSSLDPAGAKARLIAELPKRQTWFDRRLLDLLPAADVPPMDDALIDGHSEALLAKYGTPEALPKVKALFESQPTRCQPELVAYFVRVDPDYADQIFHRHPWEMHAPAPPCLLPYFQQTSPIAMGPVLEKYLAAYLMHGTVFVKMMAARSLGRYGSPAAREPLWAAYRYFHDYWKGKAEALEQNGEGVALEVELRNAIARGRNWLTPEVELKQIESLCTSQQCLGETRGDLQTWQSQPRVEIYDAPYGVYGSVGQYLGLDSLEAIRAKLVQFPKGTIFQASPKAIAELGQYAKDHDLVLK